MGLGSKSFKIALILLLAHLCFEPGSRVVFASEQATAVTQSKLAQAVSDRLMKVREFEFIRAEAERLGLRAWIFGGSAAGYAHYVKWDLERENGSGTYHADRFDYDITNIYHSTQDIDIVVDGPPQKAEELRRAIAAQHPHLQGTKSKWEVRLLRQGTDSKQALLNDPDFLNQHTDSNSTGMIELTRPPGDESTVRDLRDWNAKESQFLKDVQEGKIHFYFSPQHETTRFFREGRNPAILSVVRYFTKMFQYQLKPRPEDLEQIRKIIAEFNPTSPEMKNGYVQNWLLKKDDGKKLMRNAVDMEYAWNTLENFGLRKKLMAVAGDSQTQGSLAWWLNKEPLRTKPVGTGTGKTAREHGITLVAHETRDLKAYESINRSPSGIPNLLISRNGAAGEAAFHGDGFYTMIGNKGAVGSNITIRFKVRPDAREGTDFTRAGDIIVFKNKAALEVIPESLTIGWVSAFELMADDKDLATNLGVVDKLSRRLKHRADELSDADAKKISEIVEKNLHLINRGDRVLPSIHMLWLSTPAWKKHPELASKILQKASYESIEWWANAAFSGPKDEFEHSVPVLLEGKHSEIDRKLIEKLSDHPDTIKHPEWIQELLFGDRSGFYQGGQFGGESTHATFKEMIFKNFLSRPEWIETHPRLYRTLLEKKDRSTLFKLYETFKVLGLEKYSDWVMPLWKSAGDDFDLKSSVLKIMATPEGPKHIDLFRQLVNENIMNSRFHSYATYIENVLSNEHWLKAHPQLIDEFLEKADISIALFKHVLVRAEATSRPDWFIRSYKWTKERPIPGHTLRYVADALKQPLWAAKHPELIAFLIENDYPEKFMNNEILSLPHWSNSQALLKATGGMRPNFKNLKAALNRGIKISLPEAGAPPVSTSCGARAKTALMRLFWR